MRIDCIHQPGTGEPALAVGSSLFGSMAELAADHPELVTGDVQAAAALARAYNHLARGDAYEVIDDPEAFEAAYRAACAAEDPAAPWSQAEPRLTDFGMPEFSLMHAPLHVGDGLSFFARDAFTGVAYRVSGPWAAPGEARYEPMPLRPWSA